MIQKNQRGPRLYKASTVYMLVMIIVMLVAMLILLILLYLKGFAPLFCEDFTYVKGQKMCLTPVKDYNQ